LEERGPYATVAESNGYFLPVVSFSTVKVSFTHFLSKRKKGLNGRIPFHPFLWRLSFELGLSPNRIFNIISRSNQFKLWLLALSLSLGYYDGKISILVPFLATFSLPR